jgi:branched-chain amino acid aminotransferase
MLLLNPAGRLAEASAACVLVVRHGAVATPPATEGALESITVGAVERICGTLGIEFARRPIERSELLVADEIAICGTLDEIRLARSVDGLPLPDRAPVLEEIQRTYLAAVRGERPHEAVALTPVQAG